MGSKLLNSLYSGTLQVNKLMLGLSQPKLIWWNLAPIILVFLRNILEAIALYGRKCLITKLSHNIPM